MDQSLYNELDPVNESRALVLLKGDMDDPITCRLQPFTLDKPLAYEALSYVWGTRSERKSITMAGQEVKVTQSLEAALRHLRQLDCDRILWVDAICINQDDAKERGHQVGQMGKIYQRAKSVTVWLGLSQDRSDHAMDLIRRMNQGTGAAYSTAAEPVDNLKALGFLMNRQWFRRRWVAQEIAYASTAFVQCGHSVVTWHEFANTIDVLQTSQDIFVATLLASDKRTSHYPFGRDVNGRQGDIRARDARHLLFISSGQLKKDESNQVRSYQADIGTLVSVTSSLHVSDPRDFVYSLVSLASDTYDMKSLVPDYEKSNLEVCIDLVSHVIKSKKCLDLICQPWAPSIAGLPSWVLPRIWPRYTLSVGGTEAPVSGESFVGLDRQSFYHASNKSHACAKIWKSLDLGYVLQARGFIVDTLSHVEVCSERGYIPIDWRELVLKENFDVDYSLLSTIMVGGKTLTGAKPPESYSKVCHSAERAIHIARLHIAREELLYNWTVLMDLESFPARKEALDFLQRAMDCICGRRLIKTSQNRLGLAPRNAQPGDLIAILLGCSVPVVLRSVQNHHILVGEAYVQEIMDGEAMTWREETKTEFQDFVLK